MLNFNPDYQKIKATLDGHNIKQLYHFTTIDNLSLISKCDGLWSKKKLEKYNLLDKILTGGNELSLDLDKELGN